MTDDGESMESIEELALMDAVTMELHGLSGGKVKVSIYYTGGDNRQILYTGKHDSDFYQAHTPRGTIKNDVEEALEDYEIDSGEWVKAWQEWTARMMENADEAAVEVVHKSVRDLAEGTGEVRMGMAGEKRIWKVEMTWNGHTSELEFDHTDMANGGVSTLETQMFKEFGNCPMGLENEEWDSLKNYWLDRQQEVLDSTITESDRAKETFVDKLQSRITAHADKETLKTGGKDVVWCDENNSYGIDINGFAGNVDAVAWVRGDLVNSVLDDMDNAPTVGELASDLQEDGSIVSGSQWRKPAGDGSERRYWYFDKEALNIDVVHEKDSDDENDPENLL